MLILIFQKILGVLVIYVLLYIEKHSLLSKISFKKLTNVFKESWFTLLIAIIFFTLFTQVRVASGSMEPTIMTGDRGVIIDSIFGYEPERGDVIGFMRGSEIWVKRVIGLPGDTVSIDNGHVFINGDLLQEDYLSDDVYTFAGYQAEYVVSENSLFVMGDNRGNSYDSRYWDDSFLPVSKVLGKYYALIHIKKAQ